MKLLRLLPFAAALALIACSPSDRSDPPAERKNPDHDPVATATQWRCGEVIIATRFDDASLEALTIAHSDQELHLRAAGDREGARFVDDVGNEFWSRPGKVTLRLAGQEAVACKKRDLLETAE